MNINGFDMKRLKEFVVGHEERIDLAKKRQATVWRGEKPDKWPITWVASLRSDQEVIPDANYKEAFYDSDLMLCSQIRGVCTMLNSDSDSVPSIRANMGTGTLLTCFGLKQAVFEDKMPWLLEHLSKEQISKMTPDDIRDQGDFNLGMKHMHRFKEVMGNNVPIYCMDTQGPLDLAHLLIGDDIFLEMHDDPPFVHHLMNLCVELGIRTHTWMKELSGEPLHQGYHSNQLYSENFGIRICEDTTAIIGPDQINEFAMPYTRKLASHFGGAWVHYCGRNDHLTKAVCELPEIHGINFGHIPGHEEPERFEGDMECCRENNTIFFGSWPRGKDETGKDYFKRLHQYSEAGIMIPNGNPALGENGFTSMEEALDFWYNL